MTRSAEGAKPGRHRPSTGRQVVPDSKRSETQPEAGPADSPEKQGEMRGPFRSIRTTLVVYFSLLFVSVLTAIELVGVVGLPLTSYGGRWGEHRAEAFRRLNLVADLKKEQVLGWIEERRDNVHVCATNALVEERVTGLCSTIHGLEAADKAERELWTLVRQENDYRNLVDYLDSVRSAYGAYRSLSIVDGRTGAVVVSTDGEHLGRDFSQVPQFVDAMHSGGEHLGGIQPGYSSRRPALHIGHTISDSRGEAVAVLMVEIETDDVLGLMLHTGEGLGESGEALLIDGEGTILTPLKHPLPDGSTRGPLQYRITSGSAVLAAGGQEGVIETEDYRGEPVLAAYRHLRLAPELAWGMVVKGDRAELFGPLRRDVVHSLGLGLAGVLAIVGLTFVVARGLTNPLVSLSRAAERVARGDLDARAPVTGPREVRLLASTLNSMVERAQSGGEGRGGEVQTRTAELALRNRILDIFLTVSDEEMYGKVLEVVLEAMESDYGIFAYIDEQENLVCPSLTRDVWERCQVPDKTIIFPRDSWGGIWGRALVEQKTQYSNEPLHVPEGHLPIHRVLVVPILHRGQTIGILEVANKAAAYDGRDIGLLETIANKIAPTLAARLERDRQDREREQAEQKLKVSRHFLEIVNRHTEMTPLLEEFVAEVRRFSGCAAVGVRIVDEDGNIPYQAYEGFSREFYELESPLSIHGDQCMCINVITGTTDPKLPFYTAVGSFYMNGTTRFLATVSDEDRGRTRNVCNQFGYESVALIPLRMGARILGLIHLADPREDMVPLETVAALEEAAARLGTAIQRVRAEQERKRLLTQVEYEQARLRTTLEQMPVGVVIAEAPSGRVILANHQVQRIWRHPRAECSTIEHLMEHEGFHEDGAAYAPGDWPLIRSLRTGEAVQDEEVEIERGDGARGTLLVSSTPIRDRQGRILAAVTSFHDITTRQRLEQALRRSHDTLEKRVRERTAELAKANQELRSLASELSLAEERERRRIATALHDSLGQNLALAKIKLGLARRRDRACSARESGAASGAPTADTQRGVSLSDSGVADRHLDEVRGLIEESIAFTRSLTFELSSPLLYTVGLEAAVERLAEQMQGRHGVQIQVVDDGKPKPLDEDMLVLFFQSVRELLMNAVKHANATRVTVTLARGETDVTARVEDDGVGFDPSAVGFPVSGIGEVGDPTDGFGLFSIRERLGHLGGRLEVQSVRDRGTVAVLTAPLGDTPTEGEG